MNVNNIREDLDSLISTIKDVRSKPHLGSQMVVSLNAMGYTVEDAKEVVAELFNPTVH